MEPSQSGKVTDKELSDAKAGPILDPLDWTKYQHSLALAKYHQQLALANLQNYGSLDLAKHYPHLSLGPGQSRIPLFPMRENPWLSLSRKADQVANIEQLETNRPMTTESPKLVKPKPIMPISQESKGKINMGILIWIALDLSKPDSSFSPISKPDALEPLDKGSNAGNQAN